eukprot:TRINITY_DN10032_c1_g1_i14.p1 TRINITY_DN10032_c1_g1~~TRINITY_DN10032_c1_g1_i14.p1  ORF type:complete len:130 (-),score=2.28 TRINITY_DN10032_c1_g1_i14:49-438(-)
MYSIQNSRKKIKFQKISYLFFELMCAEYFNYLVFYFFFVDLQSKQPLIQKDSNFLFVQDKFASIDNLIIFKPTINFDIFQFFKSQLQNFYHSFRISPFPQLKFANLFRTCIKKMCIGKKKKNNLDKKIL